MKYDQVLISLGRVLREHTGPQEFAPASDIWIVAKALQELLAITRESNKPEKEQMGDMKHEPQMSYGQKAVGLSFNPSGDPLVTSFKELFAQIIDLCNDERAKLIPTPDNNEKTRLYSVAITHAQDAQMWAVKAATWRED